MFSTIVLQDGPVGEVGVNGDQIDDLIGFCADKLESFNAEPYMTVETTDAIHFLRRALERLEDRTRNRRARGVEGTSAP